MAGEGKTLSSNKTIVLNSKELKRSFFLQCRRLGVTPFDVCQILGYDYRYYKTHYFTSRSASVTYVAEFEILEMFKLVGMKIQVLARLVDQESPEFDKLKEKLQDDLNTKGKVNKMNYAPKKNPTLIKKRQRYFRTRGDRGYNKEAG